MAFLLLGILLLAMKLADVGAVGAWSWWWVLLPFGLAVAWWGFADATGFTQRRAIDKMERTKEERRKRSLEALGLGLPRGGKGRRRGSEFPAADAGRRAAKTPPASADQVGRR